MRDLRTNVTQRVSVASDGAQADGPTTEVSIDGACERVAFTTQATNLGPGTRRIGARAAQAPRRQVYVHVLTGTGADRGFTGRTFLASASTQGCRRATATRGSPRSAGPARRSRSPRRRRTSPGATATASATSTQRTFTRRFAGKGRHTLAFRTRLVSATRNGKAGNGASSSPDSSDGGGFVAFETTASNLLRRRHNGVSDIAEADLRKARRVTQRWVSKSRPRRSATGRRTTR